MIFVAFGVDPEKASLGWMKISTRVFFTALAVSSFTSFHVGVAGLYSLVLFSLIRRDRRWKSAPRISSAFVFLLH